MKSEDFITDLPDDGKIVENLTHFARALRAAGMPVGPGHVVEAVRAVAAAGFERREDFFSVMHACFVSRREHSEIFFQIFRLFWRDPRFLERMMAMLLPMVRGVQKDQTVEAAARRASDALLGQFAPKPDMDDQEWERIDFEVDSRGSAISQERLRHLDFEQMTADELAEARRIIASMRLPVRPQNSRRMRIQKRGRFADWRSTMRKAAPRSGEINQIIQRDKTLRWPNLVAICDISGSMSAYSRTVLRFLHAVMNSEGDGWSRVYAFTFGTRLTNISRYLRHRDIDAALAAAGAETPDWDGGTRIGYCLGCFNRQWSRRLMGQGAVVLLITDGLDGGEPGEVGKAMQRLHLSSRRLIWINPLLRWEGFLPKARGAREMLPHVDCFRSAHNIASLEELAKAVARSDDAGEKPRLIAAMRNAA